MAYGVILGQTPRGFGGNSIRTCRFVVGTSTAGWTAADCDYLCDGTDDQVEINAAIQALPAAGGEVVILDGTYIISDKILLSKDNCSVYGNNASTILKRNWEVKLSGTGIIYVDADYCCISNLHFDGNKDAFDYSGNAGVMTGWNKGSNNIISNCIFENCGAGVRLYYHGYNSALGNICRNNTIGIEIYYSSYNSICGNIICNNEDGIFTDYSCIGCAITGNVIYNNVNGMHFSNLLRGVVSSNSVYNNTVGLLQDGNSFDENTITGNTFSGNDTGIEIKYAVRCTISGNTVLRGSFSSSQYSIKLTGTNNKNNLIIGNNIYGKDYVNESGASNTFVNNKYN